MRDKKKRTPEILDVVATGRRIKALVDEKRIAISDIGKTLNISPQAIYKWSTGKNLPTIRNMFLLSKMLKVDVDDMLVAKELT